MAKFARIREDEEGRWCSFGLAECFMAPLTLGCRGWKIQFASSFTKSYIYVVGDNFKCRAELKKLRVMAYWSRFDKVPATTAEAFSLPRMGPRNFNNDDDDDDAA